jgi:hypothetical protein
MSDLILKYTPLPHQRLIHNYCSKEDSALFITVLGGRQSGKTKSFIMQAIIWGLQAPDLLIWYVMPSESQCSEVYRKMLEELASLDKRLIKSSTASRGDIRITLHNKSRIEFKSAKMEHTLRGSSVNYLICDESADIPKETIDEILLPTLTVTGRKGLFGGTPKGKNWFYSYYNMPELDKNYKSIKFTYKDNPLCNLAIVDAARLSAPENVFKQEYEAEFVEGGAVFNNIESAMSISAPMSYDPLRSYYIGIDVALVQDYTVITILNDKGEMVDVIRFNGKDSTFVKKSIKEVIIEFKPKKVLIERNGIGLPIYQDLSLDDEIRTITKFESFVTTNKTKNEIISNLISGIESGSLQLLNNNVLKKEMSDFYYDFSESGNIIYKSHDHDDTVMSLAFAYECLNSSRRLKNNYTIITV